MQMGTIGVIGAGAAALPVQLGKSPISVKKRAGICGQSHSAAYDQ
jgi:hypothetical protein